MSGTPHLSFPFRIGSRGRTALAENEAEHIKDEIIQLLLTGLGERAFLPELGTNIRRLTFESSDDATKSITAAAVTQAIGRWLGQRVTIEELTVGGPPGTIEVLLRYRAQGAAEAAVLQFQRNLP